MTEILVRSVRTGKSAERPTLDDAGKPVPLGRSRHVYQITSLEQISNLYLLPDLVLRDIIEAELSQNLEAALARVRERRSFRSIPADRRRRCGRL